MERNDFETTAEGQIDRRNVAGDRYADGGESERAGKETNVNEGKKKAKRKSKINNKIEICCGLYWKKPAVVSQVTVFGFVMSPFQIFTFFQGVK